MTKILRLIIYGFLLITSVAAQAQKQDDIDKFLLQQISEQKIAGLSIGIIVNGKMVKAKGYGLANLEHKTPATHNTVYKLGSVSKQMVATGIMKLVQDGKVNLTDTITKYFKGAPVIWNKITIRHLLNHTAGLPRESPAYQPMQPQPDAVLIKASYTEALVFETGTKWQYSNLGYFILADIIRQVSGKSFSQFMRDDIFLKYELFNTQTLSPVVVIPERADGYYLYGKDSVLNAQDGIALRPSGAFLSTVQDMMKWEMLIQNDKLLFKENWKRMWSDTVNTNAGVAEKEFYGYGWRISTYKNRQVVYHGGSLPGFRSIYYRVPSDRTTIIILTNSDQTNTTLLVQGVIDILYKNK